MSTSVSIRRDQRKIHTLLTPRPEQKPKARLQFGSVYLFSCGFQMDKLIILSFRLPLFIYHVYQEYALNTDHIENCARVVPEKYIPRYSAC